MTIYEIRNMKTNRKLKWVFPSYEEARKFVRNLFNKKHRVSVDPRASRVPLGAMPYKISRKEVELQF